MRANHHFKVYKLKSELDTPVVPQTSTSGEETKEDQF
jgi:hypothetical protein